MGKMNLGKLQKKYGEAANHDIVQAESYRISLETRILRGWRKRRQTTTHVMWPLACYHEINPKTLGNGTIEKGRLACERNADCELVKHLRTKTALGQKVRATLNSLPKKAERDKSKKALKDGLKGRFVSENACRDIGDAAFAILCPDNGVVLTTNVTDHKPLAQAIGRRALSPQEVIDEAEQESS